MPEKAEKVSQREKPMEKAEGRGLATLHPAWGLSLWRWELALNAPVEQPGARVLAGEVGNFRGTCPSPGTAFCLPSKSTEPRQRKSYWPAHIRQQPGAFLCACP